MLWRFAAVPSAVPEARGVTRAAMRGLCRDGDLVSAILLCVTEAVTNVVMHAYGNGGDGDFELEARRPDGFVCIYVRDRGIGMRPRTDSPGLGLGLPLIGQLSSDFSVRHRGDGPGTEIAMRFELPVKPTGERGSPAPG